MPAKKRFGAVSVIEDQGHLCAVCQEYPQDNLKNPWHVDHDHKTGKIRGILCHACNTALGNFNDDPEVIDRAAKYLREHLEDSKSEQS